MPQHKVSCFKLYQIWALAPQIQGGPLSQERVQSGRGGGGGGYGLVTKSCLTLVTLWTIAPRLLWVQTQVSPALQLDSLPLSQQGIPKWVGRET